MNIFERMKINWIYFKLSIFGDKVFDKKGCKKIPCSKCGKIFKSYSHYDPDFGIAIDNECEQCRELDGDEV